MSSEEELDAIRGSLNRLRSDGPFMDMLASERGWYLPPNPVAERLYAAIIELSEAIDAYLAPERR